MSQDEQTSHFEELWKSGPWQKRDKTVAAKRFKKNVKTEQDWQDIQLARDAYAKYCKETVWYTPKYGGTWMSTWRDWLIAKTTNVALQEMQEMQTHDEVHICDVCDSSDHVWTCETVNPLCTLEKVAPCPVWMAEWKARRSA